MSLVFAYTFPYDRGDHKDGEVYDVYGCHSL